MELATIIIGATIAVTGFLIGYIAANNNNNNNLN